MQTELHAKVAARHHEAARERKDLVNVLESGFAPWSTRTTSW